MKIKWNGFIIMIFLIPFSVGASDSVSQQAVIFQQQINRAGNELLPFFSAILQASNFTSIFTLILL